MRADGLRLQRPDGHELQVYTSGKHDGAAVLLLHGGPGGGAVLDHGRHHDLSSIRLIQFDQRGTGRSHYADLLRGNTTAAQIADIEAVREAVGVSSWTIAGGSWGALLGVLYAQTHPAAVERLVLRSIFLDRASDRAWLLRDPGPAPLARQRVIHLLDSTQDPFSTFDRRLADPTTPTTERLASAWHHFERVLSGLSSDTDDPPPLTPRQLLDVRIEMHYLANEFFVADDQAATGTPALAGLPGLLLQGEADRVIAEDSSEHLATGWPDAVVRRISGGGHSLHDAAMRRAWQEALLDPVGSLR